jgi:hypothetical protein
MGRATAIIAAFALAGAAPAFAAPNAPDPTPSAGEAGDPDVVVTGERLTGEKLHKEASEFVKRIGVASGRRPAARWVEPVCPAAYGIVDAHAAVVVAKLRQIAAEANIPTAREGCKANFAVIFAADGKVSAKDMSKRQPARFEEVGPAARERLFEGDAPIRWWYSTLEQGKDGHQAGSEAPIGVAVCGGVGSPIGGSGRSRFLSRYNSGIVSSEVIRGLRSATVVIDVNRVGEQMLDTLIAYAALVGLAEISPQDPPPNRSILSLFTPDPGPNRDLTEWDMSFLKALYRMPLDRDARMQRGLLTQELVKRRKGG